MKIVKVVWYGGRRRDGYINKFGYVRDENNNDYRLEQKRLSNKLYKNLPKENDILVITMKDATKINQAFHIDEIQKDELFALLKVVKNEEIINAIWLKLFKENRRNFIVAGCQLTKPIVKDLLKNPLDYDVSVEQLLIKALRENPDIHAISYDTLNVYANLINEVKIDVQSLEACLKDARFKQVAVQQLIDELNFNYLYYTGSNDYRNVHIRFWFEIPELYTVIKDKSAFPQLLNTYANLCVEENRLDCIIDELVTQLPLINNKYADEFRYGSIKDYWRKFDNKIIEHPALQALVPIQLKIEHLNTVNHFSIENMIQLFEQLEHASQLTNAHFLIDEYKKHEYFFKFLPSAEQTEYIFPKLQSNFTEEFTKQTPLTKNYIIYKIASTFPHNWLTPDLIREVGNKEENPLIKALLNLLYVKLRPDLSNENRNNFLERVMTLIEEEVRVQATSINPINLLALIPKCTVRYKSGVPLCEGKQLYILNDAAYCPRTRRKCESKCTATHTRSEGARVGPNCHLPFNEWSLQEMFEFVSMDPMASELIREQDRNYYTNKIGGWVNRLEEIRERMKCSNENCNKSFNLEFQFARRFDAVYNNTRFSCPDVQNEHGHDYMIYLSHCRCCGLLIDSRESKYQVYDGGYYICIHCGAADDQLPYAPHWDYRPNRYYQQGDICPACNHRNEPMEDTQKNWKRCTVCQHEIKITI